MKSSIKAYAIDMDDEMMVEFKDSGSSNSSSNSIQLAENRSKRHKSKVMKPTSASGGKSLCGSSARSAALYLNSLC